MVSSFSAAFLVIRREVLHCKELETSLKLIDYIKNKAMVYSMPFSDIINGLCCERELRSLCLTEKFSYKIAETNNVPQVWKETIEEASIHLEEYEKDVLINFGVSMCSCSKEEISNLAENASYSLKCFRDTAVENRNNRSKSMAAICVSLGIVIILMFA